MFACSVSPSGRNKIFWVSLKTKKNVFYCSKTISKNNDRILFVFFNRTKQKFLLTVLKLVLGWRKIVVGEMNEKW